MSAMSAFCSRWIISSRFAAIVSSGELRDAATRKRPVAYSTTRHRSGLSAVTDQQLAGVVMMAEQVLTLGTLVFVLLRPRLRRLDPLPA